MDVSCHHHLTNPSGPSGNSWYFWRREPLPTRRCSAKATHWNPACSAPDGGLRMTSSQLLKGSLLNPHEEWMEFWHTKTKSEVHKNTNFLEPSKNSDNVGPYGWLSPSFKLETNSHEAKSMLQKHSPYGRFLSLGEHTNPTNLNDSTPYNPSGWLFQSSINLNLGTTWRTYACTACT